MKHTTQTNLILTAAFFFGAANGMMAQSEVKSASEAELIALSTTTVSYPSAPAPMVAASQPQSTASSSISSEIAASAQPAAQPATSSFVKKAPAPSASNLARIQDHAATSTSSSFTPGPEAFPNTARMDPTFLLPRSQYGAAPTAVKFSFGKK